MLSLFLSHLVFKEKCPAVTQGVRIVSFNICHPALLWCSPVHRTGTGTLGDLVVVTCFIPKLIRKVQHCVIEISRSDVVLQNALNITWLCLLDATCENGSGRIFRSDLCSSTNYPVALQVAVNTCRQGRSHR